MKGDTRTRSSAAHQALEDAPALQERDVEEILPVDAEQVQTHQGDRRRVIDAGPFDVDIGLACHEHVGGIEVRVVEHGDALCAARRLGRQDPVDDRVHRQDRARQLGHDGGLGVSDVVAELVDQLHRQRLGRVEMDQHAPAGPERLDDRVVDG